MASHILLQGGTVIQHNEDDHISWDKKDILIKDNQIVKIARDVAAPVLTTSQSTTVIDCRNKIISPGFIDTHRHMWMTQLKGRHGDETLFDAMITGTAREKDD